LIFKKFLLQSLLVTGAIYLSVVLLFVVLDDYGLFFKDNRKIYTAENERTSKYLFTYNYIPSYFNGLLLGPSLGDQIDTSLLNGYKIFNLSMNGANTTELYILLNNVLKQEHQIKVIILTLHEYVTETSGRKTSHMVPQEYYASFSSIDAVKLQIRKLIVSQGLARNYFNESGYMNMNLAKTINGGKPTPLMLVSPEIVTPGFEVDENAMKDLENIIELAHGNDIALMGYFHPDPYSLYDGNRAQNEAYKSRVKAMFFREDLVIDFNTDAFDFFRKDNSNFMDGSHLSYKGEDFIIEHLNKALKMLSDNKALK